jgi:hypothetical protein
LSALLLKLLVISCSSFHFVALEVALIQNKVDEVNNIDLHGVVFLQNNMVECLDQRPNDNVSYFV